MGRNNTGDITTSFQHTAILASTMGIQTAGIRFIPTPAADGTPQYILQ